MNDIEIKNGTVLKEGKEVGTIGEDGKFSPVKGLHHKTIEAINARINLPATPIPQEEAENEASPEPINEDADTEDQPQGETVSSDVHDVVSVGSTHAPATTAEDPEPEQDPQSGDKTPAYVEWYARNHTKAEFDAKYPPNRKLNRPE